MRKKEKKNWNFLYYVSLALRFCSLVSSVNLVLTYCSWSSVGGACCTDSQVLGLGVVAPTFLR